MSTLTNRLPDDKHECLQAVARANSISINMLMDELATVALANYVALVRFETRTARADHLVDGPIDIRRGFQQYLDQTILAKEAFMTGLFKLCVATLLAGFTASAVAVPVTMQFSVGGFGSSAPTDPVFGTITWQAASATSTIDTLTSISLVIDGHSYNLAEIGYIASYSGDIDAIFGSLDGVANRNGYDDFTILWSRTFGAGFDFSYTSSLQGAQFRSSQFSSFSVTEPVAIPEPGSLGLLGIALTGAGLGRLWRRPRRVAASCRGAAGHSLRPSGRTSPAP